MTYSDHRLHTFALQNALDKFVLDDDVVMSSGKCQLMAELLKELQVKLTTLMTHSYLVVELTKQSEC